MSDLTAELTAPNGVKYTQPTGLFINNEWVKSTHGEKITSINPTYVHLSWAIQALTDLLCRDESEIVSVYAADAEDVDIAVKAARKAFKNPSWRDLPSVERAELLYKLVALVEKNKEVLATIETWDNGKTLPV